MRERNALEEQVAAIKKMEGDLDDAVTLIELGLRLGDRALIALGLAQLGEGERIFKPALQPAHGGDRGLQMRALAHQLLRGGGVIPEIGVFGLGVQLVEPPERAIPVKDASSAAPTTS